MSKAKEVLSGKEVGFPYSFSRWTDVCCSTGKWEWFQESLKNGYFIGFHPTEAIPYRWSLRPDDVLGLIFWTKDPSNLIWSNVVDRGYNIKAHITVTGWEEVEGKAPKLGDAINSLGMAINILGSKNVYWRFSPVPMLPHSVIVEWFGQILAIASNEGLDRVYLSFLQENDLMPEIRSEVDRLNILLELAELSQSKGVKIYLCNEDRLLLGHPNAHPNLDSGVCAPPEDFSLSGYAKPASEGCGCVLMVDPFTVNESCSVGCKYCYSSVKDFSPKRRDTTKQRVLPLVK
jgi:hypothetical protein